MTSPGSPETALVKDIAKGRLLGDRLPMLPDRTLSWDLHELPDNMGIMLIPQESLTFVVRRLARAALTPLRLKIHEEPEGCKAGSFGFVALESWLATKTFYDQLESSDLAKHASSSAVQANVMIHEGLKRLGPKAVIRKRTFVAPEQYGALIRRRSVGPPVWVMQHMLGQNGNEADYLDLPPNDIERHKLLLAAIAACGGDESRLYLDDRRRNYILDRPCNVLARVDVAADLSHHNSVMPGQLPVDASFWDQ